MRFQLAVDCVLPQIGRDALNFFFQEPEDRHLRSGPKFVGILKPNRHPLLAQFDANFLQAGPKLFHFDAEIALFLTHRGDSRVEPAVAQRQLFGASVEALCDIVFLRFIAHCHRQFRFLDVRRLLGRQDADLSPNLG